jgi:hypothetical protein
VKHRNDPTQEAAGIGSFPLRVCIRKVRADVSERGCSEEGIRYRVEQHIGIGMARKPTVVRDFHAAKDQRASLSKPVYVIPESNANHPN